MRTSRLPAGGRDLTSCPAGPRRSTRRPRRGDDQHASAVGRTNVGVEYCDSILVANASIWVSHQARVRLRGLNPEEALFGVKQLLLLDLDVEAGVVESFDQFLGFEF